VVVVQPVELCVEVLRQHPLHRAELQSIRQRIAQLLDVLGGFGGRPAEPRVEVRRERAQQRVVCARIHPPHPRELRVVFDQLYRPALRPPIFQQHPDIHPLIANQIRRIPQDPVRQCGALIFTHGSPRPMILVFSRVLRSALHAFTTVRREPDHNSLGFMNEPARPEPKINSKLDRALASCFTTESCLAAASCFAGA